MADLGEHNIVSSTRTTQSKAMAAMNEDTPLLSVGTRSSSLRRSPVEATTGRSHLCSTNTLKMICILFIAIGAAGLLFIGGDNQQGHFLKASIRQSSAVTDTIRLEPAAHLSSQHSKTKGVELSTPATEQAVGSVGSNDEEETQLDSAVAEIETTGTSDVCISYIFSAHLLSYSPIYRCMC